MPGGFQSQVNVTPAPAVAGDFASSNPRSFYDAGPGGLVAGTAGLTVGNFAWTAPPVDPNSANIIAQNYAPDAGPSASSTATMVNVAGFVHREQQGLITTYLADASMVIPQGFPVTLSNQGDFWAKNAGSTAALVGQKAFALLGTGGVIFGNAGSTQGAVTITGSTGPQTTSFTGAISGNVLTVTGTPTQPIVVGTVLGTAGGVVVNTIVMAQTAGVSGSAGSYLVNIPEQTVASTGGMTGSYGILTASALSAGTIGIGMQLTSGTIGAGTTIASFGTGTGGGSGTYYLTNPASTFLVSGAAGFVTSGNAVETKWYAASAGLAGEIVKITSWVGTQG